MGDGPSLIGDFKDFLLRHYHRFYTDLDQRQLIEPLIEAEQLIDAPLDECYHSEALLQHATQLQIHLEQNWHNTLKGLYLVPSYFYGVEDLILLVEIDHNKPPTISQLRQLLQAHAKRPADLPQNLHIFLLLPNFACYLGAEVLFDHGWHHIMAAPLVPDVFSLLHQPQFTLRPGNYPQHPQAPFNLQSGHYIWSQRLRWRQHLAAWADDKTADKDFLCYFWKSLQLTVTERSLNSGQIHYPLTIGAIQRGLDAMGEPLPAALEPLAAAYHRGLAGQQHDTAIDVARAKDFLRRLDPQGHRLQEVPAWLSGGAPQRAAVLQA